MKRNKKYLKAAERIVTRQNSFCCRALKAVDKCDKNFHKMFKPNNALTMDAYFSSFGTTHKEDCVARSLALILMYEMGEE